MRRLRILALLLLLAPAAHASRESDDALARYLESKNLSSLLIDHLEAALARAAADERLILAERLATLYAETLERTDDPDRRAAMEARARALLDSVPEAESFDLRLNLHRAAYARAEQLAERWRLRLASPAEKEEAERHFRTLVSDLGQIGAAAHRRVEALERQEELAADSESSLLQEALASARRNRSIAMYLAGWSGCYLAELTAAGPTGEGAGLPPPGVLATESIKRFGWLLNAAAGAAPTLEKAAAASLKYEHVARAALGAGTCASLRGEYADALKWFDLVDASPDAPAQVKEQVFPRRLVAAARANEWIDALRLVRKRRGEEDRAAKPTPLSPVEARLLAVLAFESQAHPRSAQVLKQLRETALADLVARDELAQALDLTARFGSESLSGEGFIVAYVRGLRAYERAREAHAAAGADPDAPPTDRAVTLLFQQAEETLRIAVAAPDAERFAPARAHAALLYAMAGHILSTDAHAAAAAAQRFERAASLARSPEQRADAAWMRLRALDLAAERAQRVVEERKALRGSAESRLAAELVAARDAAVSEFVARFSDDPRAATLLLRQSSEGRLAPAQAIDALLRVSPDAPAYPAARREAARLLYIAFRDANESARHSAALHFARIADEVFRRDLAAAPGDPDAARRASLLGRQLLDALLGSADRPSDAAHAQRVADALAELVSTGALADSAFASELLFRRAQLALARADDAQAHAIADQLHAAPDDRFAQALSRILFRRASADWSAGKADGPLARRLALHGGRALLTLRDTAGDDAAAIRAAVAHAALWLWEHESDEQARDLARRMVKAGLAARPTSETLLRLAVRLGDRALTEASWRTLLAGAEVGSPAWFEAKAGLIGALISSDPAAARDMLDQHAALYPDYGPPPWGARLRDMHAQTRQGGAR